MCDGKTFSTKDIKNPPSRLVAQLTCQLEPTQGGALLSTTLFTIYLGGAGGLGGGLNLGYSKTDSTVQL